LGRTSGLAAEHSLELGTARQVNGELHVVSAFFTDLWQHRATADKLSGVGLL